MGETRSEKERKEIGLAVVHAADYTYRAWAYAHLGWRYSKIIVALSCFRLDLDLRSDQENKMPSRTQNAGPPVTPLMPIEQPPMREFDSDVEPQRHPDEPPIPDESDNIPGDEGGREEA